jgi:hypothetical protein
MMKIPTFKLVEIITTKDEYYIGFWYRDDNGEKQFKVYDLDSKIINAPFDGKSDIKLIRKHEVTTPCFFNLKFASVGKFRQCSFCPTLCKDSCIDERDYRNLKGVE